LEVTISTETVISLPSIIFSMASLSVILLIPSRYPAPPLSLPKNPFFAASWIAWWNALSVALRRLTAFTSISWSDFLGTYLAPIALPITGPSSPPAECPFLIGAGYGVSMLSAASLSSRGPYILLLRFILKPWVTLLTAVNPPEYSSESLKCSKSKKLGDLGFQTSSLRFIGEHFKIWSSVNFSSRIIWLFIIHSFNCNWTIRMPWWNVTKVSSIKLELLT